MWNGSESIEMDLARGENEWIPYGKKGVDCGSKLKAVRGRPRLGWMDSLKVALGS